MINLKGWILSKDPDGPGAFILKPGGDLDAIFQEKAKELTQKILEHEDQMLVEKLDTEALKKLNTTIQRELWKRKELSQPIPGTL